MKIFKLKAHSFPDFNFQLHLRLLVSLRNTSNLILLYSYTYVERKSYHAQLVKNMPRNLKCLYLKRPHFEGASI